MIVEGEGAKALFQNESGGHRWQRIPPTEKRGRVQTSTITVVVLENTYDDNQQWFKPWEVELTTTRGSGPGGQNRNKTESCVIAVHKPTGIQVRIDNERSQHQNRRMALQVLKARIDDLNAQKAFELLVKERKEQAGTGMRGDKIRTYREKDDIVNDHRTGTKSSLTNWLKGNW